jgi:hypothetical protein
MKSKDYEDDWKEAKDAMDAAVQKRNQLENDIAILHERVTALETLMRSGSTRKGRMVLDQNTTEVSAVINVIQPRVTEAVKGVLMASREALTSGEIHEKLKLSGWDLSPKSNPWALIHGICRRLVDQQFAREVDKGGRKAWIRAK